jgi:hypothetical protein
VVIRRCSRQFDLTGRDKDRIKLQGQGEAGLERERCSSVRIRSTVSAVRHGGFTVQVQVQLDVLGEPWYWRCAVWIVRRVGEAPCRAWSKWPGTAPFRSGARDRDGPRGGGACENPRVGVGPKSKGKVWQGTSCGGGGATLSLRLGLRLRVSLGVGVDLVVVVVVVVVVGTGRTSDGRTDGLVLVDRTNCSGVNDELLPLLLLLLLHAPTRANKLLGPVRGGGTFLCIQVQRARRHRCSASEMSGEGM